MNTHFDHIEAQMKLSHAILNALEEMSEEDQVKIINEFNAGNVDIIIE